MSRLNLKHPAKIIRGKIETYNKSLWQHHIFSLEGKEVEIIIKEKQKKPTLDQFAYYRGGILGTCHRSEMFSYFDNQDQIHENYFAPKFLSYKQLVVFPNEKYEVTKIKSMSELNRKETAEFIDRVIADCEMNGIHILSPEEYYQTHYKTIYKNETKSDHDGDGVR